VSALLQELSGTPEHQPVNVLQDFTDLTVKNARPQDSGIPNKMLVFAQLQEPSGIQPIKLVIVHQDYLDLNV
jgi:hypothetical protein